MRVISFFESADEIIPLLQQSEWGIHKTNMRRLCIDPDCGFVDLDVDIEFDSDAMWFESKDKYVPIFGLASLPNKRLNVNTIAQSTNYFAQTCGAIHENGLMLELEVQEEDIKAMRVVNMEREDDYITKDYKSYLRFTDCPPDYVVMLDKIKSNQVVSVYLINGTPDGTGVEYTKQWANAKLFPMWNAHILSIDGANNVTCYKMPGFGPMLLDINELSDVIGMRGAPRYFTLKEALACCDTKTKEILCNATASAQASSGEALFLDNHTVYEFYKDGFYVPL